MRTLTILFSLFSFSLNIFSQAVIVRNNGESVECKITKIDSLNVYFDIEKNDKIFSTVLKKSEINEIIYNRPFDNPLNDSIGIERGFGEYKYIKGGKQLNIYQLARTMRPNEQAYKKVKLAPTMHVTEMVLSCAGGFLIGWPVGTMLGGGNFDWSLARIGIGFIAVAIPIEVVFKIKVKQAIDIYNSGLQTSSLNKKSEIYLSLTENGVGLMLRF